MNSAQKIARHATAALCLSAVTAAAGESAVPSGKTPALPAPEAPSPFLFDFELRGRFEFRENNFDFNSSNGALTDDSWFLTRARLGLGWKPVPWLKIYAQGQDARELGSDRPNIPGQLGAEGDDSFDLRQFYIQMGEDKRGASVTAGRQLLTYGDQRLIGPLDWNNFSRSFDAVKLRYAAESWSLEGFAGSLVTINDSDFNRSDLFDNEGLGRDQVLSGLYFSSTALDLQTTDLYAFYLHESFPVGDSDFVTLGTRWKSTPGKLGPFDYTVELAAQTGDVKGKDLAAFAGHAEIGYTFETPWKPRVALDYSYGSGDGNAKDGKVGTFQNLYPTNHLYYGAMDAFSWQNIHDLNASLKVAPSKTVTARADFHAFWLADTNDAWYRANGVATVRPVTSGAGSYAGSEADLTLTWAATKNLGFAAGYSHFFAGSYLKDTGASSDADFVYVQATLKF